mgnify:FL=1
MNKNNQMKVDIDSIVKRKEDNMNEYYIMDDGFFTYYVNKMTGEKKFKLDKNDIFISINYDDFIR